MSTPKIDYIKSSGFNVNIWLNDPSGLESFEGFKKNFFPGQGKEEEEESEEDEELKTDESDDLNNTPIGPVGPHA